MVSLSHSGGIFLFLRDSPIVEFFCMSQMFSNGVLEKTALKKHHQNHLA